jgi:hypothetical protein
VGSTAACACFNLVSCNPSLCICNDVFLLAHINFYVQSYRNVMMMISVPVQVNVCTVDCLSGIGIMSLNITRG